MTQAEAETLVKGDKVICVDTQDALGSHLTEGKVYSVANVRNGGLAIALCDIGPECRNCQCEGGYGWKMSRFEFFFTEEEIKQAPCFEPDTVIGRLSELNFNVVTA